MYHSLIFNTSVVISNGVFTGKNTWDEWHLIPSQRPVVASPGISTNFVEVPGRDDLYDMSEYLTGGLIYSDRSGSWEFYVDNDHEYWVSIKDKIMSYFHNKRLYVVLEDEPEYYYEGRFTVNNWRNESWNSMVAINYVLKPYKKHITTGAMLL